MTAAGCIGECCTPMLAPCAVWACTRPAVDASGLWCAVHHDPLAAMARDADALEWLALAEGMTLAEVAALT
jgi:hypothetical protein